ncbi:MAG: UDP-3-O-acyl-N-acetylglucosamine deacetylase [Oligosphaeraceae bacterium]
MSDGRPLLLQGSPEGYDRACQALAGIPVDLALAAPDQWQPPRLATTILREAQVEGPATYHRGETRRLRLLPALAPETPPGWHFWRQDLPEELPIPGTLASVSQARRAIVLRAGAEENALRMSEHVICQKLGLGIDCLKVELLSEDPPLFDQGSLPLVHALEEAGLQEDPRRPLRYVAPQSPVCLLHPENGGFLLWAPPEEPEDHRLFLDVAVDFPTAIGKERLQLCLHPHHFRKGAAARTNCSAGEMRMARLLSPFVSSWRNLGYTDRNILLAGNKEYANVPNPDLALPGGKSLEPVWHRTCLDLVAALSLLPPLRRPAGRLTSFKAGHLLDVRFLKLLLRQGLLKELP